MNINNNVIISDPNWIYPGGAGMERELNAIKFQPHWGWNEELKNVKGKIINKALNEELWFYLIDIGEREIIAGDLAISIID